jgi:hypothetical protein
MDQRSYTEIGVAALVILICAVVLVQANDLPPGTFEPLGSGPVPIYTSLIIILCCVIVIMRAIKVLIQSSEPLWAFQLEFSTGLPIGGILMLGITIAYVSLLHFQVASFGFVTFLFLAILIWSMERFNHRKILPALAIAAVFSFGAEYIFTNVFVVDLPT